ncbi:Ger(x)C family spore germination protein [Paenibacillus aestuarii]|uniref:Ger(X)C family spore germination protein n=1 Tax=Paenibacillus aestuarii TaxID=516965 RepID=A0ABW0K8H6_9BACL|nr:Ger(x)C family spore germination protein [Paenibacillus aestuarii]
MKGSCKVCISILILACLLCGCWDRKELNDQVFDLAGGIDLDEGKGKRYLATAQLFIPSKTGEGRASSKPSYFLETSSGTNIYDSIEIMQRYLSRSMTRGHRRNLFIGEKLAKSGISEILDSYTHDPDSRLRTDIWVVKDGTAMDIMKVNYPLEELPGMAPIKIHQATGGIVGSSLVEYLIASRGEGSSPTLPVMQKIFPPGLAKPTMMFYGRAIFNHDNQLVGYLDNEEAHNRDWILGLGKYIVLTSELQGQSSGVVFQPKSKIRITVLDSDKIRIEIAIKGHIVIKENNTSLVLSNYSNLMKLQESFNQEISKQMLQLIEKVQKTYKLDVLGIGETLYRQHPNYWKQHKKDWDTIFVNSEFVVRTNLEIKQLGQQNSSIQVK